MAIHVVEKQVVSLKITSEQHSHEIMQRVQPLFENFISDDLALFLDSFDNGAVIQIDQIELDLGKISVGNFDTEIREAFRLKLNEYFQGQIKETLDLHKNAEQGKTIDQAEIEVQNQEQYWVSVWRFFLENGYFPSSFTGTFHSLSLHLLEVLDNKKVSSHLKSSIFRFENLQQLRRFVLHVSDVFIHRAFVVLSMELSTLSFDSFIIWKDLVLKQIQQHRSVDYSIEKTTQVFRALIGHMILNPSRMGLIVQASEQRLIDLVQEIIDLEKTEMDKDESPVESHVIPEVFVKNAGIVILAPYLLRFFQNLALVEKHNFSSLQHREKAIKTLCYLATGGYECTEDELVLFKFLCAYPTTEPLDVQVVLPSSFYEEAELLLESIIEHWTVLKGSSSETLRETFLTRAGKLIEQNEYWILRVESRGVDILLDKIPWTFRTIKLPWMPKSLLVEWY